MPDSLNMASSGKKTKKSKGKTLPLNHFLQEAPGQVPAVPVRKSTINWADEVEDTYDSYESKSKPANVVLPTAPKAARGLDDFSDKIPSSPPYIAYLSNLPYDVDEDEIADFFRNLKISNMRLPKEERGGESTRSKGFGYIEFEDQDSLKEALGMQSCTLKGRRIRIEVSENDRRKGGRMDMNRDRPDISTGDWRSGGRKEPEMERRPTFRDREGGSSGGFNREGGSSFNREGMRDPGDRPERSSGAWRDNDRAREDKPMTREGMSRDRFDRDTGDRRGGFDRDGGDRRGGFDRDRDRDGGERRGGFERDGDRRGGYDRDGGDRRGGFGPRRDERNGGGGGYPPRRDDGGEARTRPKLNLAPRTKPIENPPAQDDEIKKDDEEAGENPPPVVRAPVPAASIFGNAKPVDTAARERQIEERLAKQTTEVDKDDRRRDEGRSRRMSPERRRYSPRRSPNNRKNSQERRSPESRRSSDRRRDYSPDKRSSERKRGSPDSRRSPSPDVRGSSPDRNNSSPELKGARPDEKKGPLNKGDKGVKQEKEKKPPREYTERDMPKLKTPEPVNIVAQNQFSCLGEEEED